MAHGNGIRGGGAVCALLRHALFTALSTGLAVFMLPSMPVTAAEGSAPTQIYQKPVSAKLNSTGRTISMPLPVRDESRELGDVVVKIGTDDTISVPKAALVTTLNAL